MGWVGPRVRRPAIKALVLASYLIVGQVAQFGNWAYSAKQNKGHPRSPSDTVVYKLLNRYAVKKCIRWVSNPAPLGSKADALPTELMNF